MENPILDSEYVPPYAQKNTDMSVGDWVATLILTAIPLVGFICLIVWAVSSSRRSGKIGPLPSSSSRWLSLC